MEENSSLSGNDIVNDIKLMRSIALASNAEVQSIDCAL